MGVVRLLLADQKKKTQTQNRGNTVTPDLHWTGSTCHRHVKMAAPVSQIVQLLLLYSRGSRGVLHLYLGLLSVWFPSLQLLESLKVPEWKPLVPAINGHNGSCLMHMGLNLTHWLNRCLRASTLPLTSSVPNVSVTPGWKHLLPLPCSFAPFILKNTTTEQREDN